MLRILKWIFILAVCSLFVVVAIFNRNDIHLNFPFFDESVSLPVYAFFFISVILGIVLGGIVSLKYKFKSYSIIETLRTRRSDSMY